MIDGRPMIVDEISSVESQELKAYLASQMTTLLETEKFLEALPGHLAPDIASQSRKKIVLARMSAIAS